MTNSSQPSGQSLSADGQELIEAFFEALRLRRLEQSQTALAALEALLPEQPALEPWQAYLRGVLTFEVDHRWAEAERIFSDLLQGDLEPALRGRVLYALGRSLDVQGRWQEAIAAFEQIVASGQTVDKAKAWKHMAHSLYGGFMQGDVGVEALRQAVEYCRLALDSLKSMTTPEIVWLKGSIWNALGFIYVSLGQWPEAIACYEQDLAICRRQDDRFGMGITYGNLGEVYQKQGDRPEALQAYQQALRLIREFGGRYEEIDVLANLAFVHQEMEDHDRALDYYDQTIAVIETLRAGVSSEEAQAGFFATVVDVYANAVLLCLAAGREGQAFDYVERARSRAFLDTLAGRSPEVWRQMDTATVTLAEVQVALPAGALLLEYFTTGLVEVKEDRGETQQAERHRFPPARTLLFAITQDALRVYDLGFSPNDLRPDHLDNLVERHFLRPPIRQALYQRLIAPVEALLGDKQRLYLIPHGPLHYIPFQALLAPDGETLLRAGGPQLIYAPSATLLCRYRRESGEQASRSCLALGYNSQQPTQLLFAEDEANTVAHLTAGHALTGTASKKAILFERAGAYRLLHLACHGEFDPESPLASFLNLAPEEPLTALEVLENLRLRCDLVTLSACESGLSRVRRGDELVGFTRAFMYAGAPALVSTLWRVNDHSTRILMNKFYQEIQRGVGFAAALKQAQLFVKNLTYREALQILTEPVKTPPDVPLPAPPSTASPSEQLEPPPSFSQAAAYLRGLVSRGSTGVAETDFTEPSPDEKIFADPTHWAAFILIGDHGS